MRHRVRTARELERFLAPTPEERAGIERLADRFHFVITPYYAALMDPADPACPIRRQVVAVHQHPSNLLPADEEPDAVGGE